AGGGADPRPTAAALAAGADRAARRARNLGDEPVHAARPARARARDDRPAPVANRDGLRPVRTARDGRARPLALLGRQVRDGWPALGPDVEPGGGAPPVDRDARARHPAPERDPVRAMLRARGRVGAARRPAPVL